MSNNLSELLKDIPIPEIPLLAQGRALPAMNSHERVHADSENIRRAAETLASIQSEIESLRNEVSILKDDLASERNRAEAAEKSAKRLSFLVGVLSIIVSSILPLIFEKLIGLAQG